MLDRRATFDRLRKFDFTGLFTQELGWDWFSKTETIEKGGQVFTLKGVAEKRGVQVFHCSPDGRGEIPPAALRAVLERELTKRAREHLVIFADAAQTEQLWLYPRREPGKPVRQIPYRFDPAKSNELLIQKLSAITFALSEEEGLDLLGVTHRLKDSLDRDTVTKSFYQKFEKERLGFQKFLKGIPDVELQRWYVAVLLNRLMFIYFIQEKGFLDNGDQRYLQNKLAACKGNYYRDFLCPLFFSGFALRDEERPPVVRQLLGQVPYLNGGIFQKHQIEEWYGKAIEISNTAFARLFAFFDQYRWHLDERPIASGNEINPDVLGYIFEKYINQKQMGAYYTKEDITGYISKNTVIPFLLDATRAKCKVAFENPGSPTVWDLLKVDPDRYIYQAVRHGLSYDIHQNKPLAQPLPLPPEIEKGMDTGKPKLIERRKHWNKPAPPEYALPTEIWREVVARRQRSEELHRKLAAGEARSVGELITLNLDIRQFAQDVIENCEGPDLLRAFWKAIEQVTVLNPTCGSGAFLFAALNILKPLYEACLYRMEGFVADLDHSGEKQRPEKFSDFRKVLDRVAAHPNRMEEAVEICKLRLFLKLAAQVEPDPHKENLGIEPLPDIDFNIRAGNTLVGYATAEEVRHSFEEGGKGHVKMQFGEDREEYRRFGDQLQVVDAAFRSFRQQQTELGGTVTAQDKQDLQAKLKALDEELNRYLAREYGVRVSKKAEYEQWLESHRPFHWFVEFYGIIQRGGFDVIIGNPPYVVNTAEKVPYRIIDAQFKTQLTKNLYPLVFERSIQLGHKQASLGLIVQLTALSSEKMQPLQDMLLKRGLLMAPSFPRRPESIFDGVEMPVVILVSRAGSPMVQTSRVSRFYTEERAYVLSVLRGQNHAKRLHGHRIGKLGSAVEIGVVEKLETAKVPG